MIRLHDKEVEDNISLEVKQLVFSFAHSKNFKNYKWSPWKEKSTKNQDNPNVLDKISFSLHKGEIVVVGGNSGCGKSTLLRLIAGFEYPQQGEIFLNGVLYSSPQMIVAPEHRRIGLLFQDHALFPQMTVEQNIQFGISHLQKDEQQERIINMLQKIKLIRFAHRFPDELSIGQIQRVALARALVIDPLLLLLDEPFSSLDKHTSFHLIEEIQELKSDDTTILMVTHESQEALYLANRIMLMGDGRMNQSGTPEDIYFRPQNDDIANYFDEINFLPIQQTVCGQLCSPCGFIKETLIENYQDFKNNKNFHICVRPHMIQIKSNTKARYQQENWKVIKKYFMGNHYKIVLESQHPQFVGLRIIVVQALETRWPQLGELIQVSIISNRLWALENIEKSLHPHFK